MNKISVTTLEGATHIYEADDHSDYVIDGDGYLLIEAAQSRGTYPPGQWTFVAQTDNDDAVDAGEETKPSGTAERYYWSDPYVTTPTPGCQCFTRLKA